MLKTCFIGAIERTFYRFTGALTHAGCSENTRKKSFVNTHLRLVFYKHFSCVLSTFRVGYHAGKLIERAVNYLYE